MYATFSLGAAIKNILWVGQFILNPFLSFGKTRPFLLSNISPTILKSSVWERIYRLLMLWLCGIYHSLSRTWGLSFPVMGNAVWLRLRMLFGEWCLWVTSELRMLTHSSWRGVCEHQCLCFMFSSEMCIAPPHWPLLPVFLVALLIPNASLRI